MKKIIKLSILNFSFLAVICFPQQSGWEIIPSGTTDELNSVYFFDYGTGYACGKFGTVIKSVDSGKTWQTIQTPVTNNLNDLYVFDENTVTVLGDSGTWLLTFNSGAYWYVGPYLITEDYYSVSFSGNYGICGGSSQTILYLFRTDSAITAAAAQTGYIGGGFWGAIMLSPEIGYVAGENSIFQPLLGQTTDSGQNWNFSAFYLNNNEGRATGVDFTDMFIGYVSARVWDGRGGISKTTNSGNDWETTFFNNPLWDIDFPISATGLIGYAIGDSGTIYKTYDAGINWQPQQSGTSAKLNGVHFLDLDYGFAVGENGTLLRTTTGGEPLTQVSENLSQIFDFKLEQNYPNPFNPATTIKYQIPELSFVTLKIYDVLGSEIITLVNEEKSAGNYEVEFNASSLPSGVYFYILQAGSFVETKKMVLMK